MSNKKDVIDNFVKYYLHYEYIPESRAELAFQKHFEVVPKKAQIEIVQGCNLRCITCPIEELPNDKTITMSSLLFKTVIDKLPSSIESIVINGIGEPFIAKDFVRMLEYAKSKGLQTEYFTNGMLFDNDALPYSDTIHFSIDAANKSLLELIRKGVDAEKLHQTIKQCVDAKKVHSLNCDISFSATIGEYNWREFEGLYELADALGVDNVRIYPAASFDSSRVGIPTSTVEWSKIVEGYLSHDYDFNLTIFYPRRGRLKGICPWTFTHAYIDVYANLIPCCYKLSFSTLFGNLLNEEFDEIYFGEKMQAFRRSHIDDAANFPCDFCPNSELKISDAASMNELYRQRHSQIW